jgi:hypothetical protein
MSLSAVVESKLVRLIPQVVAAAGIREPVYCVALAYDPETECLPPMIGLGLERERRTWIREHGRRARGFIWNPAEFTHFDTPPLSVEDPDLEKACRRLNEQMDLKGTCEPARKLLNSVAAASMQVDWSGKVQTTPDFIVYAVDLELTDLKKNLQGTVPAPLLEAFKQNGLL